MKNTAWSTQATSVGDMRWGLDSSRGFTLIELLVTMGIVLIVLTAAYQSYIRLLRGFVVESTSAESQMANVVNANFLRLDIAHAGYGLAHGEGNIPIEWDNSTNSLTIRSMINNLDQDTLGWVMCNNGTVIQNNNDSSWEGYVFLAEDQTLNTPIDDSNGTNCPSPETYLGYPYEISDPPSGCGGVGTDQPCYNITYELSSSQNLDTCADGTRNLLRKVSGNAKPILNCVADWQLAFELDTSGDGSIDTYETDDVDPSANDADQIKQVHVYALVQEGSYERDYSFSGDTSMDGVNLALPGTGEDEHYRWKMQKISIKPQDL